MSAPQNIIALIFDFDDTLGDDSITKLLETHGISAEVFWGEWMKRRVDGGWDPAVAYMDLILDRVGEGRDLGELTNAKLRAFGSTLDFYDGIPDIFTSLKEIVQEHRISRPSIEFYIVSGGLEEVIRGTTIAEHFTEIWGGQFEEVDGRIGKIKSAVSFTEKTKFLFAINKGFETEVRSNPYVVNRRVVPEDRRIPLQNMIYIGDGITDVPCFSVIRNAGGKAFGVFNPNRKGSPKKAWELLVAPERVHNLNSPRYGPQDDLGALVRVVVEEICLRLETRGRAAV